MSRIVVMNQVTLDGVMQAPGRVEDTRDGFGHSGWAERSGTPAEAAGALQEAMGERMVAGGGLAGWLFGRRTYEDLLGYWNQQPDSPFTPALNNTPKYVASTTLAEPLAWPQSTLLHGDVAGAVGALKARTNGVLAVMGSGQLIEALAAADLIDEYLLMIHPLVLGEGRRLFPAKVEASLRLVGGVTVAGGVIIAAYERTSNHRG
ncbi:MAG: dihydrofolate reductase family protein [Acidimicrobiales bacterium]